MTSVAAMEGQLRELKEQAAASAEALRGLIGKGSEIEALVQSKRSIQPMVSELRSEAEMLSGKLKDSSNVVQKVVESVRVLDKAQANTRKALDRTVDVVGLKSCVEDVSSAMASEQWEQAAESIQRYLHVAPEDSVTEEAALESLRKSLDELRRIVQEKCQDAAENRDQAGVVRFCRLMTHIGLEGDGVSRFTQFLGMRVQGAAEEQVQGLKQMVNMGATGGNVALYAKCLTSVLEVVASAVTEGEELMASKFGEEGHGQMVAAVYSKAAPSIAAVLELMHSMKSLKSKVAKYRDSAQLEHKVALDLDVLLEEVSLCLQRLEQFEWFLASKLRAAKQEGRAAAPSDLPRIVAIDVKKAELISGYIPLEEAFLRHSVEKAIRSKEHEHDEDNMVSSLVDEVFFVLKKCTRRALATSSINAMGDVIMYVHQLLVTTYKDALEQLLAATQGTGGDLAGQVSAQFGNLFAGTTVGGQVAELSRRQVQESFDGACYNNIEVSAAYILKLHASLEKELKQVFRGASKADEDKAREVMAELAQASQVLSKALNDAINRLAVVLERFFDPQLNAFQSVDYQATAAAYVESPAVVELVAAVEATLDPFREGLNSSCFDHLVLTTIAEHVVPSLEKIVLGKKAAAFSALGAMQFDKDLRALTAFFSGLTQRTVRDQFTRLSQISLVLNFGDPSEIWEYNWGEQGVGGSASILWRLTADEVKKVMERRVDFRPERIKALRL